MMSGFLKRFAPLVLLAAYAGLSLSTINLKSATWDETHYLGLGSYLFRQNQWDIPSATLHPPLSYYIHSLPLLFCSLDQSCFEEGGRSDILSGVRRGQCLMRDSVPSGDALLTLARLPMIGIGVLLGFFVYRWASTLYGTGGGLLSLFLYCLSPNILAHTGLITPDLCLTAFGFMTVYFFWQHSRSGSLIALVFTGIALGLTLLSKHSGLLWVPTLALLAMAESLHPNRSPESGGGMPSGSIVRVCFIFFLAFAVLSIGYQFDLSAYFSGIDDQRRIVGDGFPAYLNGQVSRSGGWWHYYLFAFLIKVPVPGLILLSAAFLTILRGGPGARSSALWLITPALLIFAAFSIYTQVNIGLRYVLPAFPFLMVFAGGTSLLWKKRKLLRGFVGTALLLWYAGELLSIHPHHLAYFNQIAGGSRNGHLYLLDSNLDWGQDLKGLKKHMDAEGISSVKLSYFGTADPDRYGIRYETLPSFADLRHGPRCKGIEKGDIVAVSATNLHPIYVDLGGLAEHLRRIPPISHVGHSILLYRLDRPFRMEGGRSSTPSVADSDILETGKERR